MMGASALVRQLDAAMDHADWPGAQSLLHRLLKLAPNDAGLWVRLSYVESLLGRYRNARDAAACAAAHKPNAESVALDVLARLRTFNDVSGLRGYLDLIGSPKRMTIPLLLSAASQFSSLNDQTTALQLLDEAKRGDPHFPPTLTARSQVLMYLGRTSEARVEVETSLKRAPNIAQSWWLLSQLGPWSAYDNHVAAIQGQCSRGVRKSAEMALLANALHREMDEVGDVPGAWSALKASNAEKRKTVEYDPAGNRLLFDALCSVGSCVPGVEDQDTTVRPVFVLGMHRSGTTLLEQILSGHPEVHGAGELYDFTSAMRHATDHHCQGVIDRTIVERAKDVDFAEVGRRYLDGLAWRLSGERFVTDKLPSNFLNIGFICKALPQARILHMVRDPVEVCFSNLRELFSSANPYSYDQIELAGFYLQYQRLMAHWHRAFPGRILDVHYRRLVAEPEATVREACDFVGLDYREEMLDIGNRRRAVATASAVQVRSGITKREVPKWKPYEQYLQPMINRLREGGALEGWSY